MTVPDRARRPVPAQIDLVREIHNGMTITNNLGVGVVITSREKIENALLKSLPKYLEWNVGRHAWLTPASLFGTIALTFFTADFRDMFGLTSEMLQTGFACVGIFSFGWAAWELRRLRATPFGHEDVMNAIVETHAPIDSEPVPGYLVSE